MSRTAITLVEVVVVVLIVAILAAVIAPHLLEASDDAALHATVTHIRAIEDAAAMHQTITGDWPETTYWFAPPHDSMLANFGNFIDGRAFKTLSPIGGFYMWGNVDYYGEQEIGAILYNPRFDSETLVTLDALVDDGDLRSGKVYLFPTNSRMLYFPIRPRPAP